VDRGVNKTRLANGVRILTCSMPYLRSVSMGVWVDAGARDERASENGLSHLIEHMIFKGTRRRSAYQIAKEFDAIGGQTNAFTSMENTCYHAKVLDTHLETMVDILTDIFLNSVFDETELDRERTVILQEIGMVEDSPEDYIHTLINRQFWGDTALGRSILGTRETMSTFGADSVRSFFRRLYQPERMVIAVAGNVSHERFVDMVAPAFEAVQGGSGFPERRAPTACYGSGVHDRNLEQVHLCLGADGMSVTDPRRYALSLMSTLMGGNMSSRLFQEVRERLGIAYSVYCFANSHADSGMFGVYAGVAPERVEEALDTIVAQMRRLKQEPVEAAELDAAKEYTKGNLLLASESNDNQMVRLAQNEIHFGGYIPMDTVVARIEQVTPEDIRSLACTLFRGERLALSILGPVDGAISFNRALRP
jgi:predicted Zn-dependent peptidase